jgi:Divergent InlB B-repeat domain
LCSKILRDGQRASHAAYFGLLWLVLLTVLAAGLLRPSGALAADLLTGSADSVTSSSADLHAIVDSPGELTFYYFQWGPTTDYGSQDSFEQVADNQTNVPVSDPISGLAPSTTYHYRLVGKNNGAGSAPATMFGADQTFTTSASPGLTVTTAGSGSGTVSGSGIACPGTCSASFPTGTVVVLVPAAVSGSSFIGWSGACSGIGTCSVKMTSDQSVTATFERHPSLTVGLSGPGKGTITALSISCPTTCSATYAPGTLVAATASPSSGSSFAGWGGACSGTGACTVTMNSDQAIVARFVTIRPPAPACTLEISSRQVLLARKSTQRTPTPVGELEFRTGCDETARVAISGLLDVTSARPRNGGVQRKSYVLRPRHERITAHADRLLEIGLPQGALRSLAQGAAASVHMTLTATNQNGTNRISAVARHIRGVT